MGPASRSILRALAMTAARGVAVDLVLALGEAYAKRYGDDPQYDDAAPVRGPRKRRNLPSCPRSSAIEEQDSDAPHEQKNRRHEQHNRDRVLLCRHAFQVIGRPDAPNVSGWGSCPSSNLRAESGPNGQSAAARQVPPLGPRGQPCVGDRFRCQARRFTLCDR